MIMDVGAMVVPPDDSELVFSQLEFTGRSLDESGRLGGTTTNLGVQTSVNGDVHMRGDVMYLDCWSGA
jgi:hypothetical protein